MLGLRTWYPQISTLAIEKTVEARRSLWPSYAFLLCATVVKELFDLSCLNVGHKNLIPGRFCPVPIRIWTNWLLNPPSLLPLGHALFYSNHTSAQLSIKYTMKFPLSLGFHFLRLLCYIKLQSNKFLLVSYKSVFCHMGFSHDPCDEWGKDITFSPLQGLQEKDSQIENGPFLFLPILNFLSCLKCGCEFHSSSSHIG